jgi:ribosomal protein S18
MEAHALKERKWTYKQTDDYLLYVAVLVETMLQLKQQYEIKKMCENLPLFTLDINKLIAREGDFLTPFLDAMSTYRDRKSQLVRYVTKHYKIDARDYEQLSGVSKELFSEQIREARATGRITTCIRKSKKYNTGPDHKIRFGCCT